MFNLDFLAVVRAWELVRVVQLLPAPGARILEIGAGTGQQALLLAELGYDVVAVDVEASNYREAHMFAVRDFDGRVLPFEDDSFDVVFSSNVLEHVHDLDQLLVETTRVLRPTGLAIHVVPTAAWRLWTTLSAIAAAPQRSIAALRAADRSVPKRLLRAVMLLGTSVIQRRHGEKGNVLTETWHFRSARWRREFASSGFSIVDDQAIGLFYTGNMVLGRRLPMGWRQRLAPVLGSACHTYVISPK